MRQTTVQYLAFDRVKLLDDRTTQAFGKSHQVVMEMTPNDCSAANWHTLWGPRLR